MKISLMKSAVAGALCLMAVTGAQAATTTISNGTITAAINDGGTFAGWFDTGGPGMGSPGLNWMGTEFVNIDNPSAWWTLRTGETPAFTAQYGSNPAGSTTFGVGPSATTTLGATGLSFIQTVNITGNTIAFSVSIKNISSTNYTNVFYGVGIDPDQGGSGVNSTYNRIAGAGNNAAVSAALGANQITLRNTTSAAADDIRAFINTASCCSVVNPGSVFSGPAQAVNFNTFGDDSISLAYRIGSLNAGATATIGYEYTFAPVPEPEIYAMLGAGLGLMGFVARRRKQQAAA